MKKYSTAILCKNLISIFMLLCWSFLPEISVSLNSGEGGVGKRFKKLFLFNPEDSLTFYLNLSDFHSNLVEDIKIFKKSVFF